MKPAETLGVILKLLGFASVLQGLAVLPTSVKMLHAYPDEQALLLMIAEVVAYPTILIVGGWLLIRRTDWFVQRAYPAVVVDEQGGGERARELLGVLLKGWGYWEIVYGSARLPVEFATIWRGTVGRFEAAANSGIIIVAGCFLVFATEWCVQFAFRQPSVARNDEMPDSDTASPVG